MTDEEWNTVKKYVADYVIENRTASSREIAEAVYDATGIKISHVTIQAALHDIGYVATRWMKEAGE